MIMISLTDDHDITHWSLMTEEELLTVGTDVPVLGPPATQNAHSPSDIQTFINRQSDIELDTGT